MLRDGEQVRLGDVLLIAHHTPGHTRGATTGTPTLVENGSTYARLPAAAFSRATGSRGRAAPCAGSLADEMP